MRIRDVMTRHPLTVGVDASRTELEHLLDVADVHHLPLMDGDRVVGLWVATTGGLQLLGPESVLVAPADAEAAPAIEALIREHEAVLVREGGEPVGLLTRTNAVEIARLALGRGLGRRDPHPVVLRLVGPAEAGKTTLLIRTLPRLSHCQAAVVMTDEGLRPGVWEERLAGARMLHAPEAGWRRGLYACMERLADAQLVLIEDVADLPDLGRGSIDDLLVPVVPAGLEDRIGRRRLRQAAAVVLTRLDVAPSHFDLDAARELLRSTNPGLAVFGTAALQDDRGLAEWADWIEGRVLTLER